MHTPRKRFGQNFLKDNHVIQEIIDSLHPSAQDHFVEIGPGKGALTIPLLNRVSHLEVIELDRDLIDDLHELPSRLPSTANTSSLKWKIHQADALQFDYSTLIRDPNERLRIVGNLPYNISTPLIFHLLEYNTIIQDMHFMLQYEVVERLIANPNTKAYGKLSVMLQYYCQADFLFPVESDAFYPKPKVRSAVVRLIPYTAPPHLAQNIQTLRAIVHSAFNQRRKTLHNSLKDYLNDEDFLALHLNPSLRAEQLTVKEFVNIANYVEDKSHS